MTAFARQSRPLSFGVRRSTFGARRSTVGGSPPAHVTCWLAALLFLPGCRSQAAHHTPPSGIPESATLITERSGGMGFTAPNLGTIYIYNEDTRRVIYKSAVNYRDQLIFYPQKDRIILNGTVVREDRNLNEDHVHRLYFVKG